MTLSARRVESAGPGKHGDGRGLILVVKPTGARSWVLRYQLKGRRRDLGLGPYPEVALAHAREKALEARRLIAEGIDPLSERKKIKLLTFRVAASALIESKRSGWKNAKHAAQWTSTLHTYAMPKLGDLDVKVIETADVISVLKPIWNEKTETASRLRQRIEAVLDYATAIGVRNGDNPARWRGHLDHLLPRPSKVRAVRHHAAMAYTEVPEFMAALGLREGVSARALAFTVLTAARSGETREMRWAEIDFDSRMWIIPAQRMKAAKEHRVPLTDAALNLLAERGNDCDLVFGSDVKPGKPISDMSMTSVLRRMNRNSVTGHGFRSAFRDWAGETTAFPREVIEAALAHRLKDKAEAAYARGDLFDKRRQLMEAWAALITGDKRTNAHLHDA